MKNKKITLTAAIFTAHLGIGQINTPSQAIQGNSGASTNVGIGTVNGVIPNAKLEIISSGNQFRISNSSSIFSDINTTSAGHLIFQPGSTTGKIAFGIAAPASGVGFHSNMGIFRISDNAPTASPTKALQVTPNYAGNGEIPAGVILHSISNTNLEGLSFLPTSGSTAGVKLGAYAYSFNGWKSMWETSNVQGLGNTPNLLLVKTAGNVGIGTGNTIPTSHLQMISGSLGTTANSQVQWVNFSGNVGSGNSDQLRIYNQRITGGGNNWNSSEIKIQRTVDATNMNFISFRSTDPSWGLGAIVFGNDVTDHMAISYDGKVSIGALKMTGTHSDAKLSVDGKIVAKEIVVTTSNWADYVFAKDYKLPNLYEIEKYYLANKHLPQIPSEKEVIENGIDLAEMNVLLLKKVEELTILMVEQNKRIKQLENKL